ncbi:MAG: hypothetical protein AB9880_04430 [Christensenellales bacterium]
MIQQLSILIDQRPQRLAELIAFLKASGVDLRHLTMTNDAACAVLRTIIPEAQSARQKLQAAGFTAFLSEVLVIDMASAPEGAAQVLQTLAHQEILVDELSWVAGARVPCLLCRAGDCGAAGRALATRGIKVLDAQALWQL